MFHQLPIGLFRVTASVVRSVPIYVFKGKLMSLGPKVSPGLSDFMLREELGSVDPIVHWLCTGLF